ncbi:hypothetical protein H8356DRAFT_1423030 [Neocallimastix lanati (nom. inval.)]|nr:hypothetical protein H8356DRAFT_1423030 [Neocallimastix sp. JGI-2020a]
MWKSSFDEWEEFKALLTPPRGALGCFYMNFENADAVSTGKDRGRQKSLARMIFDIIVLIAKGLHFTGIGGYMVPNSDARWHMCNDVYVSKYHTLTVISDMVIMGDESSLAIYFVKYGLPILYIHIKCYLIIEYV